MAGARCAGAVRRGAFGPLCWEVIKAHDDIVAALASAT